MNNQLGTIGDIAPDKAELSGGNTLTGIQNISGINQVLELQRTDNTEDIGLAFKNSGGFYTGGLRVTGESANGNLQLDFGTNVEDYSNLDHFINFGAGGKVGVDVDSGTQTTKFHVKENTTYSGYQAGITIQQMGTGDALLHFGLGDLFTGENFTIGIDNSDGDKFKISNNYDFSTTPSLCIDPANGYIGINTSTPDSTFSICEDNAGIGVTTGLSIKQDGTGDALLHFVLSSRRWIMGVDNSDSDSFKISTGGTDLDTGNVLKISTDGTLSTLVTRTYGSNKPTLIIQNSDNSQYTGIGFQNSGSFYGAGIIRTQNSTNANLTDLHLMAGYSSDLSTMTKSITIDGLTKYVGIGTGEYAPIAKLEINAVLNDTESYLSIRKGNLTTFSFIHAANIDNQAVFKLGRAYIWSDSTGALRTSTTFPASSTSGTIIGTQS